MYNVPAGIETRAVTSALYMLKDIQSADNIKKMYCGLHTSNQDYISCQV